MTQLIVTSTTCLFDQKKKKKGFLQKRVVNLKVVRCDDAALRLGRLTHCSLLLLCVCDFFLLFT